MKSKSNLCYEILFTQISISVYDTKKKTTGLKLFCLTQLLLRINFYLKL